HTAIAPTVHSNYLTSPTITTTETAWKRRYRAARTSFPTWARENPDNLLYLSNASGRFEVYAWSRLIGTHRQVTDRPEGTGYRVASRLDLLGQNIWWFDDAKGNELGRYVRELFGGGERVTMAPELEPAYSAGLALGSGFGVLGRSTGDEGTTIYFVRDGEAPRRLYQHRQSAYVVDLSRDQTLVAITHSEHGDSRNPAIRVLDLDGRAVAELWDGPGLGLEPVAWSPLAGDQRLLAMHDRRGRSQPLILNASSPAVDDIELDLPGETSADWYPDAKALLIAHEYGGPTAHDQDAFYPGVQAWVDHGFAVVLVNYRGSTGYGKEWRDANVGRVGLTELEDIAKVHDRVIADGVADPKRVILSGGSWGGYLTLMGLGTQPERWSLGIPIVPVGEYLAAYEDEMEPLKKYDDALFGGSPAEVPEKYRESNPITYVEHIRVPMLL